MLALLVNSIASLKNLTNTRDCQQAEGWKREGWPDPPVRLTAAITPGSIRCHNQLGF